MKNLLTLLFILPFIVFSQKSVIGKPYNLDGLEIAQFDFTQPMNYDEATEACSKLGDGWRLPTRDELEKIYENKSKLDGFVSPIYISDSSEYFTDNSFYYWSNSSYDSDYVWCIGFEHKFIAVTLKTSYLYVRAVKMTE